MDDAPTRDGRDELRARLAQMDPKTINDNHQFMMRLGADALVRVVSLAGPMQERVFARGYFTTLPVLSGRTPKQMREVLGLRAIDLVQGAAIYVLDRVPPIGSFLPRGYSTLPDGRPLIDGVIEDEAGYRRGHGAWQATLIEAQSARLVATVPAGQRWEPGMHPKYRIR